MKQKLILVKPTDSPFIKVDEIALSCEYQVETILLNQSEGRIAYLYAILLMLWKILTGPKNSPVLVWFADYHALPAVISARLTTKKSLVFIGGYDAVCYPAYRYGVYCNVLRKLCASIALKYTDLIIANDEALLSSENRYYNPKGHPEGVFRLIPSLNTPALVIDNAVITKTPEEIPETRNRQILCVGGTPRYEDIYNKGFDLLFELARLQPDWRFVLVGIDIAWLPRAETEFRISELSNLIILPPLPHEEVIDLMLCSEIYVQPSISEGMPNALMEAMLCGCKPVGSKVAGIPKIIGEWGIVYGERKAESLKAAIEKVQSLPLDRHAISESIGTRFSLEIRRDKLLKAVSKITSEAKI